MLFTSFYYIVAFFLWLLFIPYLLLKSKNQKYKDSIPARFFLYNNPPFEKELIHFHSCSLGEVRALKPIIDEINQDVNITTTTNTGFEEAKKLCFEPKFLPYEIWLPFWYRKQKVLVVLEAELWYMLFLVAKNKGAKTILLNARISDKSYNSYKRLSFFYKRIFQNIDYVFAQTKKDEARLKELGAKDVQTIGNIKVFQKIKVTKEFKKPDKTVLTLASTHEGEEIELLKNIKDLSGYKVIIVPRHPERFDKVSLQLEKEGFAHQRYSKTNNFEADITLVDAMGELINIYAISDIVLLGGSFVDGVGGHNPLEPAFFNTKIVSGEFYFNQKALYVVVEDITICKDISKLDDSIMTAKKSSYEKEVDFEPILKALR